MILNTIKECVEYTISMFASDPYGFCDNVNEIEIQYLSLRQLSNKYNIDFKECMYLYNSGKKLYDSLELKSQMNYVNNILKKIDIKIDIDDKELNDALKILEKTISEFEFSLNVFERNDGDSEKTEGMLQNKKYVDGLISNLKHASITQITTLIKNINILHGPFRPNYYTDEYLIKLLEKNLLYNKRRMIYDKLKY